MFYNICLYITIIMNTYKQNPSYYIQLFSSIAYHICNVKVN